MQIIEMVKSHPVPFAIGACVLLLLVTRGGSASASNSSGAALATSAMTNNTQLATVNAGMSVQLGAQSVEKYQIAENAALARTGVAASMLSTMVQSNAGLIASSTASNAGLVAKAIDGANSLKQFQMQTDLQQSAITANVKMNGDNLLAQIQMHTDDNNNKLSVIGAQTQGSLALMGLAGDINAKLLPSLMQNTQELARINGSNAIEIAKIQTQAANTTAQANKNKADWGIVTDIGKEVGKFIAMM